MYWGAIAHLWLRVCVAICWAPLPLLTVSEDMLSVVIVLIGEILYQGVRHEQCFPQSLLKKDSENSPEYSEFLYLCGNHWT